MKLKVSTIFQDIKTNVIYNVGDIIEISDDERAESLIKRNLCVVYDEKDAKGEIFDIPDNKVVHINDVSYELKEVKKALKSIDMAVAGNATADTVTDKLSELSDEQSKAVIEILSK